MQKADFLKELQERAKEQKRLREDIPLPSLFSFIAIHLGDHPWRPLIPLSILASICMYFLFGTTYIDFALWIFKVL